MLDHRKKWLTKHWSALPLADERFPFYHISTSLNACRQAGLLPVHHLVHHSLGEGGSFSDGRSLGR